MTVQVHVDGRVAQGRLADFAEGLEVYLAYAREHGYATPLVLQGLSGPMNSIRLIYTYDDLAAYEEHEARTLRDPGYAEAAAAMEFADSTITYSLFRVSETAAPGPRQSAQSPAANTSTGTRSAS